MPHYVDTSALVKLVVAERESVALSEWTNDPSVAAVSSDLARVELLRSVRRLAPDLLVRARLVLDGLTLVSLTPSLCEWAGRVDPPELRSLDALHVTAALELGEELEGLVTYDDRQAAAARANGVVVLSPGR